MSDCIKINLDYDTVSKRNNDNLLYYMSWNPQYSYYINEKPGNEHYRMLAEISHQLPDGAVISDIGTYYGASALALSSNPKVNVTTYDINVCIPTYRDILTPIHKHNIRQKVMSGQLDIANISKAHVVCLDIDPHDGIEEIKFFKLLEEHKFRGILLCDDIFLNEGMTSFWEYIPKHYKKVDITHIAHYTGTGAVIFDPEYIDLDCLVIEQSNTSNNVDENIPEIQSQQISHLLDRDNIKVTQEWAIISHKVIENTNTIAIKISGCFDSFESAQHHANRLSKIQPSSKLYIMNMYDWVVLPNISAINISNSTPNII